MSPAGSSRLAYGAKVERDAAEIARALEAEKRAKRNARRRGNHRKGAPS